MPTACGWGDVGDAGKENPNILTVVESGSRVADRHVKHFVVCTPHGSIWTAGLLALRPVTCALH